MVTQAAKTVYFNCVLLWQLKLGSETHEERTLLGLAGVSQESKETDFMLLLDLILNFHHKVKTKTLINILFPLKLS